MGFDADVYAVDQLIRPVANLYRISTADGRPTAFVRQKKLAIKEDIRFFADEEQTQELFRIKARAMFEVAARYDVTAPDGERIGVLQKAFTESLLRSTWKVLGPDEAELAIAEEKNMLIAVVRRFLTDFPLPIHFTIRRGDEPLGEFRRRWGLRDRYTLDLSPDTARVVDRRLAVALAVALDALQSR